MMTKRWWVVAEQFFPTAPYKHNGLQVIHRLCFKRSEWTDTGLKKNKFILDFNQFNDWRVRLYRDDNFSRIMWPGHLKHQRKINDWLMLS